MLKRWQRRYFEIASIRSTTMALLTVMVVLVLVGGTPVLVEAAPGDPVDLQLGGIGATSWNIGNIKPGDNGTQPVSLHNAGTRAGFVTIWVSDIISGEGLNPESETGDKTDPGELDKHLLFGISSNRSSTTLNLPATIGKLPQNASDPNSIEIMPLKSGETVDLEWSWRLPPLAGNDVQGDSVSFTLNYLLREFEITDVSGSVDITGAFTGNVIVTAANTVSKLVINKDTVGKTKENQPLSEVWLLEIDKESMSLPGNKAAISGQYEIGPYGATFDRPVTITFAYDSADIPERDTEDGLVLATWDEVSGNWTEISGSTADKSTRTVSARVSHFSRYAILATVLPPLPPTLPAPPPVEEEPPLPPVVEAPAARPALSANILGNERRVEIEADGTLLQSLSLTDPDAKFIIELIKGSRITSDDGTPITRIEVRKMEDSVALLPADIIALGPIYKVTGYVGDSAIAMVNFIPFARLTILYDPKNLPGNTFPPFIANYTNQEEGWAPLKSPPGAFFEVGKAEALVYHGSFFAAVARLAPPPSPLPAKFEASNLTISPTKVQQEKPVAISLTVTNKGDVDGSYEVYLIIDGIVQAVEKVTLAGYSSKSVRFEVSDLTPGRHRVSIAGLNGEFQVTEADVTLPAQATLSWLFADLSVGVIIGTLLLALYLTIRRARRSKQGRLSLESVLEALRRRNKE